MSNEIEEKPQTKPVCTECGSDEVFFDAVAEWNPETGKYEMTTTHDDSDCGKCEGECQVEWVPVTPGPVTVLQLAEYRIGRKARNGQDFEDAMLPMIGGCGCGCGETVAAYNSCPGKGGYILGMDCVTAENTWTDVAVADKEIFGDTKGRKRDLHTCDNCQLIVEINDRAEIVSVEYEKDHDCVGEEFGLHRIHKLTERLDPGGVVPSGECPECGSLCYPLEVA